MVQPRGLVQGSMGMDVEGLSSYETVSGTGYRSLDTGHRMSRKVDAQWEDGLNTAAAVSL